MNLSSILTGLPFWVIITGAFLVAFLVTFFSIPSIVKISKAKGLLAIPNSRTSHIYPTPNLGGFAIFFGFIISIVIFSFSPDESLIKCILCSMIILLFIGLKDDILILDPNKKILGHFISSLIIVMLGDLRITDFHNILGINEIPYWVSIVFTVLLFVFIIISFNFIDGIDGLASGLGIIISVFYGIYFILTGHSEFSLLCIAFSGSLIAFFIFNVFSKQCKIFMGDEGAMITGLLVAVFTVKFLECEKSTGSNVQFTAAPALAISLLLIPMFDAIRVLILRIVEGHLFTSARIHIYHLVLKICDSHIKATIIIILINLFFLLLAVLFQFLGNILLILFMILFAGTFYLILFYLIKKHGKKDKFVVEHQDIP